MLPCIVFLTAIAAVFADYSDTSASTNSVEDPFNFFAPSFLPFPNVFNMRPYAYSFIRYAPNANAQASSSITFSSNGIQQLARNGQGVYVESPGGGGAFGSGFTGTFTGPVQGSLAAAAIGPGGGQQIAAVYPENAGNPNVNTRFASTPLMGGGFYGVSTSSQSASSDLNGQPVNFHRATTTVNDNGKVTTYTVQNP